MPRSPKWSPNNRTFVRPWTMEAPVVSPTAFPVLSCTGAAISRACSFLLRTWIVLPTLQVKYNGQNYAGKINTIWIHLTIDVNTAASDAKTRGINYEDKRENKVVTSMLYCVQAIPWKPVKLPSSSKFILLETTLIFANTRWSFCRKTCVEYD